MLMKITIFQTDIVWSDSIKNIQNATAAIDKAPHSDLYIFPEMFSTGFCTSPSGIAERGEGKTLEWMKETAMKRQCAIAGSVPTEINNRYYNRFYFVYPSGEYDIYDKKHLFTYGGEDKTFSAGSDRVVVTYKGIRILLQICYDLRFPVFSRNRKDYDMIIYVASWPDVRIDAWKTLIHARAIENQCFVAAVNRVGNDPYCKYIGGSEIIDPYGKTIIACEDNVECAATTDIDITILERFREKFPVLNDSDNFLIK